MRAINDRTHREHLQRWLPLVAIVLVAGLLRIWGLSQNGFGRTYYAASVFSMLQSWHNVFFNAFDPAGFVSLDKPPVAIWMQALAARLLGFSGLSIHLAQVAEGLAAVVFVYLMVQRVFGRGAALPAALLAALTPVSIAVDRSNNTESCLVLLLLAAAWAGMRAAETGRTPLLCLSMALVGLAFNVKMAAALVIVPAIVVTFLAAHRGTPARGTLAALSTASAVLVVASLWWVAVFDLTPRERRPYAGGTVGNSMLELALFHNGVDRFTSLVRRQAPAKNADRDARDRAPADMPVLYDTSPTGPARLFRPRQAGQAAWWLLLAVAGVVAGFGFGTRSGVSAQQRISIGIWGGWLGSYWVVLSLAGGTVHTYYLAVLAPPLAALGGIGVHAIWRCIGSSRLANGFAASVILGSALWQLRTHFGQTGIDPAHWLTWIAGASAGCAIAACAIVPIANSASSARRLCVGILAAAALLPLPLVAAASVILVRPDVATPYADPSVFLTPRAGDAQRQTIAARIDQGRKKLVAFLLRERGGERYVAAVPNAVVAAPLILAAGAPVIAMGGYLGDDPIVTPERLAGLVARGELRYIMLGGFALAPRRQQARQRDSDAWVRANGRPVDAALWQLDPGASGQPYRVPIGGAWVTMPPPELYDMRR